MNRRQFLCIVFLLISALPTFAQIRELHSLLPYIFFDSASAVIPDRYTLFASPEEAKAFSETELLPNTLDVYHHLLNIIGSRMQRYPDAQIEIVGCNSMQPTIGEVIQVSQKRGEAVRNYLSEIWGIDTSRLRMMPPRDFPQYRSNPRHPTGHAENRRAEILTDDWRIIQPIVTCDTAPHPELADSTLDIYNLILFRFDSPEMGPLNERIIHQYVVAAIRQGATMEVTGYADIQAPNDRSIKLDLMRAWSVIDAIKREVTEGIIAAISGSAAYDYQLHSNELPEGCFYNRCVQIQLTNPGK